MHNHFINSLDIIGAILSLISTIFYIRASTHSWPTALIAISINLLLYWSTGLYADAAKEGIYLLLSSFGWYWWLHGGTNKKELSIQNLTGKHALTLCVIAVLSTATLSSILIHFTNSQVPYWDASTTILSLIAQWLICRKIIECWIVWFVVDVMYAGMYFYKGLPAHGLLLCAYTLLAIIGYVVWFNQSRGTRYRSYKRASSVPDSGL